MSEYNALEDQAWEREHLLGLLQTRRNEITALTDERASLLAVLEGLSIEARHIVVDVQVSDYEGQLFITVEHIEGLRIALEKAQQAIERARSQVGTEGGQGGEDRHG